MMVYTRGMSALIDPIVVTPIGLLWSVNDLVVVGDADYVSSTFVMTDEDEAIEYAEQHGVPLVLDGTGKSFTELENSLVIDTVSGSVLPTAYVRLVETTNEVGNWTAEQITEAYRKSLSVPNVPDDYDESPSPDPEVDVPLS